MSGQIQDRGLFEDASEEGWKKKHGAEITLYSVYTMSSENTVLMRAFISVVPQVKKLRVFLEQE